MAAMVLSASVAGGVSAQAPSAVGPGLGHEPSSIRITPENVRFSNYLHELAGPRALIGVVGGGVLGQLRQTLPRAEMSVSEVTAAMIVHTGPGLIGYALYVDPDAQG